MREEKFGGCESTRVPGHVQGVTGMALMLLLARPCRDA
jgi:hypothetical protein